MNEAKLKPLISKSIENSIKYNIRCGQMLCVNFEKNINLCLQKSYNKSINYVIAIIITYNPSLICQIFKALSIEGGEL